MPVIIYIPKTNEFKKKFVLTHNLEYDTLHEVLESRIIIELFADEVRATLNREAGERPALSRSCDAESPPTRHWETGKLGNREGGGGRGCRARRTASLERCIVPARDRKARYVFRMPFCQRARRLFVLLRL